MSAETEIRAAGPRDVPGLLRLYRQLHPHDPKLSPDEAVDLLERFTGLHGSAVYLALRAGTIVSTCALAVIPNLTRGGMPYAVIENVVTDRDSRRRGYAAKVLTHAIEAAWSCGCYKVMLLTGTREPATLRFYEAVGFEQSKTGFQIRRTPSRDG